MAQPLLYLYDVQQRASNPPKFFRLLASSAAIPFLLSLGLSTSAWAQEVSLEASKVEGLPKLSSSETKTLRNHLGLPPIGGGSQEFRGKLRAVRGQLKGKGKRNDLDRSAMQAPLGIPKITKDIGAPSQLAAAGRWIGEQSDLSPIPGHPEVVRGGAVWQAWVTSKGDVDTERSRPRGWRGPEMIPRSFDLRSLSSDWRGLFKESSRGGLENGMSRGHVLANAEALRSNEDQLKTFSLFSNAFPQSRDSNAGAWRNLEKTLQDTAKNGDYTVYNYAGVLWQPYEYQRLNGDKAKVVPEMLKTKDGDVPKPTAYWRVAVIVPNKGPDGRAWDLAEAISHARPVSVVVPNARDADLFVSPWTRFATNIAEVESLAGLNLLTHLQGGPKEKELLSALRSHTDTGKGLPRESGMPKWKSVQLQQLLDRPSSVSKEALERAQAILKRERGHGSARFPKSARNSSNRNSRSRSPSARKTNKAPRQPVQNRVKPVRAR